MQNKIINQMLKNLPGTYPAESFELALLIIAWAKASSSQSIPVEMRFTSALVSEPIRALDTLARFECSQSPNPAGGSFRSLRDFDPAKIRPSLEFALRLTETGLLRTLDPIDISDSCISSEELGMVLPPAIATLLIDLADIRPGDTVYAPWDFSAQLSARAATRDARVYLEIPFPSSIPSSISLLSERPFEVNLGGPIRHPSAVENGKLRKFDVAVAFPMLGLRYEENVGFSMADYTLYSDLFDRFPEATSSLDILSVRHLLSQARRRVVVASSNSVLFSAGVEQTLRRDLISQGMIEAVIAMPSGLLPGTTNSFNIMVLDPAGGRERIKFINADSPQFCERVSKARRKLVNLEKLEELVANDEVSDNAAIISKDEVLANDAQLQVSRYVVSTPTKQLLALLENAKTIALRDVVKTVRPMPTSTDRNDSVEVLEVGVSELPNFGYIRTGKPVLVQRQIVEKSKSQFLRPLDIVLIIKGSVGKVGVVPQDAPPPGPGGWIAGQSAIILRPSESAAIDPRALGLMLRSPFGQQLLNVLVSGATIRLIPLRELMRMQVLVPTPEEGHRLATAIDEESRIQQQIDRLRHEQSEITKDIWTF